MSDAYGLSDIYSYFEYEFDSRDATQAYSSTDSYLDWPNFQMERPLNNIAGLKVIECQIPFSFYIVNEFNNKFILTTPNGSFTITIPEGNYDSRSLIAATTLQMQTADPLGAFVITYNAEQTAKFTFLSPSVFSLTFGIGYDNPALIYGFVPGTTTTGTTIEAPNVAAITGPMYLYLCSDSLGTLCQLHLPASSAISQGGLGPEIAKIPVSCGPFSIIEWCDPDPEKYFNVSSLFTLQSLDLYITLGADPRKPIKFNGMSFSVKLGILVHKETSRIR